MTRAIWGPPPEPDGLGEWPVHRVVRDFPETLPLLRALDLDARAVGAQPLRAAAGARWPSVRDGLEAALAWRRRAGSDEP